MTQQECLAEFEAQLGVPLPQDYRAFLFNHTEKLLDPELIFEIPGGPSGIVSYLYTACDLLTLSNSNRLGDPSRGLMNIGADQMGGFVYMCIRDEGFGHVFYRITYQANDYQELATSFGDFMSLCEPMEE